MNDLANVKAGDEIFVDTRGYGQPGIIYKVDRVTPSGRVICGSSTFRKDGRLIGSSGYSARWARPATDEDRAKLRRYRIVCTLERFRGWDKLTDEQLATALALITPAPATATPTPDSPT